MFLWPREVFKISKNNLFEKITSDTWWKNCLTPRSDWQLPMNSCEVILFFARSKVQFQLSLFVGTWDFQLNPDLINHKISIRTFLWRFIKLKQSLLLKLLGICHVVVVLPHFWKLKSDQIGSKWIKKDCIRLDQIGSNWIKLDQLGSTSLKLDQIGSN
mgnify:CR=1 FL=1